MDRPVREDGETALLGGTVLTLRPPPLEVEGIVTEGAPPVELELPPPDRPKSEIPGLGVEDVRPPPP